MKIDTVKFLSTAAALALLGAVAVVGCSQKPAADTAATAAAEAVTNAAAMPQ